MKKTPPLNVGRGPSHATRAGERVSLASDRARARQRSRGTGPRATVKKTPPLIVGLGPSHATRACERVPLAMRLADRLPHPCRSRSPDLDLFVIRRSQTTEVGPRQGFMKYPQFTTFIFLDIFCLQCRISRHTQTHIKILTHENKSEDVAKICESIVNCSFSCR